MTAKYLLKQEKIELFEKLKKDNSKYAIRNRAIIYLAEYCALRVSEIGMLQINDISIDLAQIYCHREKGSSNNTLRIIDPEVWRYLLEYLRERPLLFPLADPNILFPSQFSKPISRKTLDVIFKGYCRTTIIPSEKHHFHVLKHTRAVELLEQGLRIEDVQWWLGHKNISNTQIYAQYTTMLQEKLYRQLIQKS